MNPVKMEKIEISSDEEEKYEPKPGTVASALTPTTATAAVNGSIDEEDLSPLPKKHAANAKYPPGCPVWYSLTNSSSQRLDARRGVVEAVYAYFVDSETEKATRVYKVSCTSPSSSPSASAASEGGKLFWQGQLAYAMNCPVLVKTVENNNEMEGTIVCPRPARGSRKLSYSVLFSDGNCMGVELGVDTKRITFRKVVDTNQKNNKSANNNIGSIENLKDKIQTSKESDSYVKKSRLSAPYLENTMYGTNGSKANSDDTQDTTRELDGGNSQPSIESFGSWTSNGQHNRKNKPATQRKALAEDQTPERVWGQHKNCSTVKNSKEKSQTSKELDSYVNNPHLTAPYLDKTMYGANGTKKDTQDGRVVGQRNNNEGSIESSQDKSRTLNDDSHAKSKCNKDMTDPIREPYANQNNVWDGEKSWDKNIDATTQKNKSRSIGHITNLKPTSDQKAKSCNKTFNHDEFGRAERTRAHQAYSKAETDLPLPIASPKTLGKPPFVKSPPMIVPETPAVPNVTQHDQYGPHASRRERWTPPTLNDSLQTTRNPEDSRQQYHAYCKLTVPSWVTESINQNIFDHIIGVCDGKKGHKTRTIERQTGCAVDIPRGTPMYITIRPTPTSLTGRGIFDVTKAKEMVEDSLMELVGCCEGARARLLYELALSLDDGAPSSHLRRITTNGVVKQRDRMSNDLVWMKLLDIPTVLIEKIDLFSFNEDLQYRLQLNQMNCSVEVFGRGLNNISKPLVWFCEPFVLICASAENMCLLNGAAKLVSDAISEYQRRCLQNETKACSNDNFAQNDISALKTPGSNSPLACGKRKPPSDTSSLSSRSYDHGSADRPRKAPKVVNEKVTCILTVPLWVLKNCEKDTDLKVHLLGKHNGSLGCKQREMASRSRCFISLPNNGRNQWSPMVITIKSSSDIPSFHDVRIAMRLVVKSLIEFIGDPASERRLVHELARNAQGTYIFNQAEGALRHECHITHKLVWTKLLELPSAMTNGKLKPHGRFLLMDHVQEWLKRGANCSVEAYCDEICIPILSGPYVLVCGHNSADVNVVASRVAQKIEHHIQTHSYCQFLN
mmetsp:Transcript_38923/g.81420  ORF Transcript_38923/g.81420 Transcript_38923/m.81420 type:complete len:1069 (+) Transcript_38923:165-3371(+)